MSQFFQRPHFAMNKSDLQPDSSVELNSSSLEYIEGLYADYAQDPTRVSPGWRRYFKSLANGEPHDMAVRLQPSFRPPGIFQAVGRPRVDGHLSEHDLHVARLQERVDQLIRNYRVRGHMIAKVDPLQSERPDQPELLPSSYGFTESDLDRPVSTRSIPGADADTLGGLIQRLRTTYCRYVGVQFMHIDDLSIREWLQRRMEGSQNRLDLSRESQLRILTRLTDATIFEEFLRTKYVGAKTFSLEGAESLIPLLDLAIEKAGGQGVDEIVFGMAHRGRLNVLANILNKNPHRIFFEFEDVAPEQFLGAGDVKYHLGYSSKWTTMAGREIHLSLCFNPSHLEYVNPVVLGRVRSKQDRVGDLARERGMAILIHGDAAFIGEGVVQETLNLSQLPGYAVGGALHVVVNNQIGFTTRPDEDRSSTYCTDVAKMLQIPIFHVNGEHPEAVAQVVELALDFRAEFRRDVVIDMYCYRRWGHNEGDEPAFTQPLLYRSIRERKTVREGYLEHLLKLEGVSREEADKIAEQRRETGIGVVPSPRWRVRAASGVLGRRLERLLRRRRTARR